MATARLSIASQGNIGQQQDRPTLLSHNLKLRNLEAISLRNLVLPSQHFTRARGQTIDDDADPKSYISPGKLRALREERTLEHSHSSADLRHDSVLTDEHVQAESQTGQDGGGPGSPRATKARLNGGSFRARPKRLRRRSTLDWVNAGSMQRQEKLENVVEERMANAFFSLHVPGVEAPIYVSETVTRTMNPTYRSLDLSYCGSAILRQDKINIRFWTQALRSQQWRMLTDQEIRLSSLHYIGKTLVRSARTTEPNTILFHFTDGVYTLPGSISFTSGKSQPLRNDAQAKRRRTSSFDALLRLSKLTDSIEDALRIRNAVAMDLDELVRMNKSDLQRQDQVAEVRDRLATINFAKATVAKQIEKANRQIEEKRALIQRRRALMDKDLQTRDEAVGRMTAGYEELPNLRDEREIRKKAIVAQRRRITEDLDKIYCIRPVTGGKSLAFQIRGLPLPNAEELDSVPAATVAAALGFTAHAVLLLAFYLDVCLPYPTNVMGSTSWMSDPISMIASTTSPVSVLTNVLSHPPDKTYPLHLHRAARFRFEYGVFLLNKDIQLLLESGFGVKVLDIRHTLPNMKYLFYVATAGEGELPARKAGGIRGLMRGARPGTLSRGSSSSSLTIWSGSGKEDGQRAAQSLRKLVNS